jgi:hypothetical protein
MFELRKKVCRDCGLEKPLLLFRKERSSVDRHSKQCASCFDIHRKKNPLEIHKLRKKLSDPTYCFGFIPGVFKKNDVRN